MTNSIIENLNWRYATKRYDASKKISHHDFEIIQKALQLTPSSYGLQPNKFLIIENKDIRQELLAYSYNQQAIVDASHLLVIASHIEMDPSKIDTYMELNAAVRATPIEATVGYANFLKNVITNRSVEENTLWAQKQAYIALGVLIDVCAQLQIDMTPMEGFEPHLYNKALHLEEKGLTATLVVPLGYRHPDDSTQHLKKVRKSTVDLFEIY